MIDIPSHRTFAKGRFTKAMKKKLTERVYDVVHTHSTVYACMTCLKFPTGGHAPLVVTR